MGYYRSQRRLLLMQSPDMVDRNTEKHFKDMFAGFHAVTPDIFLMKNEVNPVPTEDDVLLFEGGTDIWTGIYNEPEHASTQKPNLKRDEQEIKYFEMALNAGTPMIGVCRGAQLLCAMSGGGIIQHVEGHNKYHHVVLPNGRKIWSSSAHHQMMNPYILPPGEWISYAHAAPNLSNVYRSGFSKVKVFKKWPQWQEQEIVWFPRTKCLAIQGHPEYFTSPTVDFVLYCRYLINRLIISTERPEQNVSSD